MLAIIQKRNCANQKCFYICFVVTFASQSRTLPQYLWKNKSKRNVTLVVGYFPDQFISLYVPYSSSVPYSFLYGMIRKLHTTGMHTRLTDKQTKNLAWRAWLCFCYVFSLNESSSSHGLVDSHAMDSSVPLKSVSALEVSSRTRKFGKEIKNQKRGCVSLELETSDIMVTHCSNEFEEVIRNHRKKQIKI